MIDGFDLVVSSIFLIKVAIDLFFVKELKREVV